MGNMFVKVENPYYLFCISFSDKRTKKQYHITRVAYSLDFDIGIINNQDNLQLDRAQFGKLVKQKDYAKVRGEVKTKLGCFKVDNKVLLNGGQTLFVDNEQLEFTKNLSEMFNERTIKDSFRDIIYEPVADDVKEDTK